MISYRSFLMARYTSCFSLSRSDRRTFGSKNAEQETRRQEKFLTTNTTNHHEPRLDIKVQVRGVRVVRGRSSLKFVQF